MSARLVFGQPIPPELLAAHGLAAVRPAPVVKVNGKRSYAKKHRQNPCVAAFGPGPEGMTCKGCVLLDRRRGGGKTFNKCSLRGITSGPATDHYVTWPACARYAEPQTQPRIEV